MGKVILAMSISLDGFTAGANISEAQPMGEEGERLHDWMFAPKSAGETSRIEEPWSRPVGAFVIGNRTFELGVEPWGNNPAFHAPCFVVAHHARKPIIKQGGTSYTTVTDGIESALAKAQAAAGDKDVVVMGGANIAQQYLRAGLIDELRLQLVPLLLVKGSRLFENVGDEVVELEQIEVLEAPGVTQLRFAMHHKQPPTGKDQTQQKSHTPEQKR